MCKSIDELMDMLDWQQPMEIQINGITLAKHIKSINVFLQPHDSRHNKNVWVNCASILASKENDELRPYYFELLRWLQDMNWPGFDIIFERLKKIENDKEFALIYEKTLSYATSLNDEAWIENLTDLCVHRNHALTPDD